MAPDVLETLRFTLSVADKLPDHVGETILRVMEQGFKVFLPGVGRVFGGLLETWWGRRSEYNSPRLCHCKWPQTGMRVKYNGHEANGFLGLGLVSYFPQDSSEAFLSINTAWSLAHAFWTVRNPVVPAHDKCTSNSNVKGLNLDSLVLFYRPVHAFRDHRRAPATFA